MSKKVVKSENECLDAVIDGKSDLNSSEVPTPANRILPEYLQTDDAVKAFILNLRESCNLRKKPRFTNLATENLSSNDIKNGYRKLRDLCFKNLTLQCELDIIEQNYRQFFDDNGKFVAPTLKPENPPPPRPLSSYILFCTKMREKLRKKQPDMPFREKNVIISKKWRDLSKEKRKVFEDEARRLKDEYDVKLAQYYEKFPRAETEKSEKLKMDRRRRMIKPPKTALDLFVYDHKQKYLDRGLTNHHQMQEAAFPDFYSLDSKEREAYDIRVKKMFDDYMLRKQQHENRTTNGKKAQENAKVKSNDFVRSGSDDSDSSGPPPKKALTQQLKLPTMTSASAASPTKQPSRTGPSGPIQKMLQKSIHKESDSETSSSSDSDDKEVNTSQVGPQNSKMLQFLTTRDSGKSGFDEKPSSRQKSASSSSSSESSATSDSEEKPVKTAPPFPSPKKPIESKTHAVKFERSSSSSSSSSDSDDDKKVSISKNNTKSKIAVPNFATPDLSKKKKMKL